MSLFNTKKDGDNKGKKSAKADAAGSKFIAKPTRAAGASKKPVKTGGSRGS